jgi:PAS domain S-box-containing protein
VKRLVVPALLFATAALLLPIVLFFQYLDVMRLDAALDAAHANFHAHDQGVGLLRDLERLKRETGRTDIVALIARVQQDAERDARVAEQIHATQHSVPPYSLRPWISLVAWLILCATFVRLAVVFVDERRRVSRTDATLLSLRSLLAAAPMAFIAWNREQRVVLWSDSAQRMFGLERARVLGATIPESLHRLRDAVEASLATTDAAEGLQVSIHNERGEAIHLSVSASRMDLHQPGTPTIAAVVEDITPHREREARRLDAVRAQRDVLIREVHHRIKNHLQGVAGLLRQHLAGKPLLQPLLETATAQILTIAAVHGLQGELRGRALDLRSMVSRIAASISGIMHVPIVLGETCAELEGWCVEEEEAVAIAMVLNEILMNAVKHRARSGADTMIRVGAQRERDSIGIRIGNPGFLPPRFNFAMGAQVGNGLGLVKSLLPHQGAMLDIREEDDMVVATLTISAPHLRRMDAEECVDPIALEP